MKRGFAVTAIALFAAALLHAQATQPADGEKFTTPGGVQVIKVQPPDGARNGDMLWVHYAGRLENGTQFDSSYDRGEPIELELGAGGVIRGWEEGLQGMQVGEKRQLIIPPDLAFGAKGRGDRIPPNSTLIFEIELLGLQRR